MYFQINDKFAIGAETYETRYSWGHKAHLYRKTAAELPDEHIISDKIIYYNRTWERYEFESILFSVVAKALKKHLITSDEAKECNDYIKSYNDQESERALKMVANIARLGDIFGSNKKESNDWKARMLKAGLKDKGLIMPADWEELDEDTKEARLNAVIGELNNKNV